MPDGYPEFEYHIATKEWTLWSPKDKSGYPWALCGVDGTDPFVVLVAHPQVTEGVEGVPTTGTVTCPACILLAFVEQTEE